MKVHCIVEIVRTILNHKNRLSVSYVLLYSHQISLSFCVYHFNSQTELLLFSPHLDSPPISPILRVLLHHVALRPVSFRFSLTSIFLLSLLFLCPVHLNRIVLILRDAKRFQPFFWRCGSNSFSPAISMDLPQHPHLRSFQLLILLGQSPCLNSK